MNSLISERELMKNNIELIIAIVNAIKEIITTLIKIYYEKPSQESNANKPQKMNKS